MFTGIVEDVGVVERAARGREGGRTLSIRSSFEPAALRIGDSIATSGVCLTVTELQGSRFSVDVGPETLARTTAGELASGDRVNLERSVTPATRLGGHLVQGHVDAVGRVERITARENAKDFEISAPPEVLALAVPRGSIAVDGISLTITGRTDRVFSVSLIPHTLEVTTARDLRVGSRVNLEADLIARYVHGLLEAFQGRSGGLTEAFLKDHGF